MTVHNLGVAVESRAIFSVMPTARPSRRTKNPLSGMRDARVLREVEMRARKLEKVLDLYVRKVGLAKGELDWAIRQAVGNGWRKSEVARASKRSHTDVGRIIDNPDVLLIPRPPKT